MVNNNDLSFVELEIFNLCGIKMKSLLKTPLSPGVFSFSWNANEAENRLPGGIYLYRINIKNPYRNITETGRIAKL